MGVSILFYKRDLNSCYGYTSIELLAAILVGTSLLTGIMIQYSMGITAARDHQIRLETSVQAQAIVQTIASEIRMLGNGVPFDQPNFLIDDPALSDPTVTYPIIMSESDTSNISFRLNETGEVFLLTQDFDPTVSLTINLTDVTQLEENDPIYITNSVVAGDDGLYGTIASVNDISKTVTLNNDYVARAEVTFAMGSILEEVRIVRYESGLLGITRDSGLGPVLLGEGSSLSLEYLDHEGNVLNLPLTPSNLVDTLRSIRAMVTLSHKKPLSTGETHSATVSQTIGIRNFNYFF
jgi:hypothetical protein